MIDLLPHLLENFARGGGGGSDSGGGGDGIIALIGYLPMHFVGALIRRYTIKPGNGAIDFMLQTIGWVIAIVYSALLIFVFKFAGFLIAIGAILGMAAGLYGLINQLKQSKGVQRLLTNAGAADSAWDENKLVDHAKKVFVRFQADWSSMNLESMKTYMTADYHRRNELLLYALQQLGRRNQMENITISQAVITDAYDGTNNSQDRFTIGFTATATDSLIDTQNNQTLFTDTNSFQEYWQFVRNDQTWLLENITQGTESALLQNTTMQGFAHKNGLYYSADMGWLLIPARGQFFGQRKFGVSDINNHMIGMQGETLVQLYSYRQSTSDTNSLLIAQMNLKGKSYGQIIVRRKKTLRPFGIRGLDRIETEWTQFNKQFEVFASNGEGATSFELLNPKYMEQLAAAPFEVNIEVVDNVVYFYGSESRLSLDHYQAMLELLQSAYMEMRL